MDNYHIPVMLDEALEFLNIQKDGIYVDCTMGGGGHSLAIAKLLTEKGTLISLDWDNDALDYVENLRSKENYICNWKIVKSNFSRLSKVLAGENIKKVNGVLFDLGVSSHQFDEGSRGFSFQTNFDLDMRMDSSLGVRAVDLINGLYEKELERLFRNYGEEPFAKRIAKAIVNERKISRIKTTNELLNVIQKVVPFKVRRKTAMRVFQALRIAVNDEINNLRTGLPQAFELLADGGRCVVISFHSLEDRVVKELFKKYEKEKKGIRVTDKPIVPTDKEISNNTRSRSAKMRVIEKV